MAGGGSSLRAGIGPVFPRLCARYLLLALFLACGTARGQSGGTSTYTFLDLPTSPRMTALGSKALCIPGEDVAGLGVYNPSALTPGLHNRLDLGGSLYYASIVFNHASFFHTLPRVGTLGVGIRQVWYGSFERIDYRGVAEGRFRAYDMALSLYYSRELMPGLRVGAALNPIFSHIETYSSLGITADIGVTYSSSDGYVQASFLARNLGGTLTPYHYEYEMAPFELLLGASVRLAHAPIRFLLTLQHLENWNSRFNRDESYTSYVRVAPIRRKRTKTIHKVLYEAVAHPIVGVEVFPIRYLVVSLSYNPGRAMQMYHPERVGLEGLSWGFGVRIKRFQFDFARSRLHAHGGMHHVSVALKLGRSPAPILPPVWGGGPVPAQGADQPSVPLMEPVDGESHQN